MTEHDVRLEDSMHRTSPKLPRLIAAIALALLLASATAQRSGGTLIVGEPSEPDTLDSACSFSTWADNQFKHLYDTLVFWGPDLGIHPNLAESWEINDDFTAFTFRLRAGVTFHDGTPFDAAAVKFNLDRLGVDECTVGKTALNLRGRAYTGTEILDPLTVRISFSAPQSAFLINAAYLYMASPTAVQALGADYGRNPVGTGPFQFREWVGGASITLERNDDYAWAPGFVGRDGPAYLDAITWVFIPEGVTRAASLQVGEIMFANRMDAVDYFELERTAHLETLRVATPGVPPGWNFNVELAPTDDVRVRQAIGMALDRQTAATILTDDFFFVAYGPITSSTLGYWSGSEAYFPYDPEGAKALLEEAGWTVGADGIRVKGGERLSLSLVSVASPYWRETWELFQALLREVGVELSITFPESGVVFQECTAGLRHICALAYGIRDPSGMRILWGAENIGSGFNWSRFADPEVNRLLLAGETTADPAGRAAIYADLQKLLLDQAVFFPVYERTVGYAHEAFVKGFAVLPAGVHVYLYDAWVDR
jgi:peptide/nickel transport system substrate-binding protein